MITHLQAVQIVKLHVKPESLAVKGAWGRELKLAHQITNGRYGDFSFWANLGLGYQCNCLAWFKTPEGQAALERSWRLYQMQRVQEEAAREKARNTLQSELDNALNTPMIDSMESPGRVENEPKRPRKHTAITWADSKD